MSRSFGLAWVLIVMLSPLALAKSKEDANTPALMTPGLWEVTVQMESPVAGAPSTSEVCIAGDQAKLKAPKARAKDDCQATDIPSASNEVAYTVQCSKQKRSSSVKFAYYGDHYEGTTVTNMNGIEVKLKYTAKRIGACDPDDGPLSGVK